jgi:PPP family 3-phenylpropionic acid transporter
MGLILLIAPSMAVLIWTLVTAGLVGLGARLVLPADAVHEGGARLAGGERIAALRALLGDRLFMLAVVSNGLIQASHGFYYSFSTLSWRRQGVADGWIGALWGFAVAVEVVFMWFAEPWRRRVGALPLIIIGGVGAMIRWTALAYSPPLGWLFAVQALHAASFTATFLGSLRLIEELSPPQAASSAQSLNASIANGVLTGLATIAAGPLFDAFGARGYLSMTLVALAGTLGALWLLRRMRPARR